MMSISLSGLPRALSCRISTLVADEIDGSAYHPDRRLRLHALRKHVSKMLTGQGNRSGILSSSNTVSRKIEAMVKVVVGAGQLPGRLLSHTQSLEVEKGGLFESRTSATKHVSIQKWIDVKSLSLSACLSTVLELRVSPHTLSCCPRPHHSRCPLG